MLDRARGQMREDGVTGGQLGGGKSRLKAFRDKTRLRGSRTGMHLRQPDRACAYAGLDRESLAFANGTREGGTSYETAQRGQRLLDLAALGFDEVEQLIGGAGILLAFGVGVDGFEVEVLGFDGLAGDRPTA